MRIISGLFKGRRLASPVGQRVRPTSDRLRETLFNVVAARVPGARVLDAFAGTGALGLEALSRGAARVTFVDQDLRSARGIEENVARCGAANACAIIRDDFLGLAARYRGIGPFDLVLLDPPYDFSDLDAVLAEAAELAAPGGLVVLEHSRRRQVPDAASSLVRYRDVVAGDSALAFYAARTTDGAANR
jgi:16S rRNA (guanine(966)-N(2))-methyltransferase RsmD